MQLLEMDDQSVLHPMLRDVMHTPRGEAAIGMRAVNDVITELRWFMLTQMQTPATTPLRVFGLATRSRNWLRSPQ